MKKLLLFLFIVLSIEVNAQTPALEMLIFPKYIEGSTSSTTHFGIPYVYRAKITGLKAGKTYRYQNKVAAATTSSVGSTNYLYVLPPDNVIPGTPDYIGGDFYRPPVATSNATNGSVGDLSKDYGLLTADANGVYTGWFIQETIRNKGAGAKVVLRILLNEAAPDDATQTYDPAAVVYMLHPPADQLLTVVSMNAVDNVAGTPKYGTAIRSTPSTSGKPKNFVFLYDNVDGTDRPVAGTVIEDDGVASSAQGTAVFGLGPFYYNNVNGVNGTWGTMVLNTEVNGIRRIEQRSLTDGSVVGYNTSADGTWADGVNPGANVSTALSKLGSSPDGNTAIVIDGSVVTLGAVKTPQTVAFTNTFLPGYTVGSDFTISASSSAGLSAFQYTVVPATGILEITGSTVHVAGAGTAVITVTEPGNATTNAGTATHSITVEGTPQSITGLAATYAAMYGDANLTLSATGGASTNPVVYTSDNTAIAEITGGNQVIIKKAGTVNIRANQIGNSTYSPAPEVTTTLTIAKAGLAVIAEDKVKTQGAANPVPTFVFGAFKGTDEASSVTGTPVLTIMADATSPAGKYDITVDVFGMTSEKYTLNPVKGSLLVEAKIDQVITLTNFPVLATYGSQPLPFQVSSNSTNEITFSSSNSNVAVVAKNALGEWAVTIAGAGEADITAAQAEDATYAAGTATQHINVAKTALNIIAEDKAKLTGEADPTFTARYEGFVNNEGASSLTGTLVFTKQIDGSNYRIVPSGVMSANYAINFVNGTLMEGNIAFAPIHKTYGDAIFDPGARIAGTGTAVYTIANAAVAIANAAGQVQIRGAGSTNITATFTSGETATTILTVDKKSVTVTADPQTRVYAQVNPVFTASYSGLVNGETDFVFNNKPALTTLATETSAVAKYAITASGAVANNYTFNYVPGVLTVTQAALMVKADDHIKVYGQANPVLTLAYSGLAPQDNGAALNLQTVVTTGATAASRVDTYPITVTGLANTTNYTVTYTGGSLSVTPALLNIKPVDVERAQGETNPVFTFTYTGFVNEDNPAVLTAAPVATTTATQTSAKGVYPITASGASSPNYVITYTNGLLLVKGVQAIVYNDLPAVSYGDANFTPAASSETGLQAVFTSDNLNVATIVDGRVKIIAAGTANINAAFPATGDFVAIVVSKALVVAKRTLIVRADSKTKLYGQANPVLTASYDGFVNGETVATAVAAQALLTTTATPLSPAGTYSITGTAASAQNYIVTYEPGVLTVNKAVLTVTADNKTRAYGLNNPDFTLKYTGFVNAETASVIESPALASTTAGPASPAGTYPITVSGGVDENYVFNYVSGVLTVTATTRTITMDPIAVKFVGDADFTPAVVLTSGETPILSSSDETVATIMNNQVHIVGAGNVTITAAAPVNVSYGTTPSTSRLLIVTKIAQTITFDAIPVLKNDGTTYTLKATATSGLPVKYMVSDPAYVSLNMDAIKGLRIGTVQITASQAGDSKYAAATLVQQHVQVVDADGEGIKVHPALSVNGDGINDHLTIDGIKDYPLNKVTIINRTGIKVFDIEGYDNDVHVFAGKSKSGDLLPQGTYFCLVEYHADSKQKRKTGYFILKY